MPAQCLATLYIGKTEHANIERFDIGVFGGTGTVVPGSHFPRSHDDLFDILHFGRFSGTLV